MGPPKRAAPRSLRNDRHRDNLQAEVNDAPPQLRPVVLESRRSPQHSVAPLARGRYRLRAGTGLVRGAVGDAGARYLGGVGLREAMEAEDAKTLTAVTGIDISSDLIALCRRRCPPKWLSYAVGDATRITVTDASFAVVVCTQIDEEL